MGIWTDLKIGLKNKECNAFHDFTANVEYLRLDKKWVLEVTLKVFVSFKLQFRRAMIVQFVSIVSSMNHYYWTWHLEIYQVAYNLMEITLITIIRS